MKGSVVGFLTVFGLGWSVYLVAHNGWYPVALVNGGVITARRLEEMTEAAIRFYLPSKAPEVNEETFRQEVRRAALDKLVEHALIVESVGRQKVENHLASLLAQNPDIERGTALVYGVPWKKFQRAALEPLAAEEVIISQLKERKENLISLKTWLNLKKTLARIFIFIPPFFWDRQNQRIEIQH